MNRKATYRSELRAEQAAATRARIIDAALEVGAPWSADLTFGEVAERARVSVRTVYRHFPTQRDLMNGVTARLLEGSSWNPEEVDADNLGATVERAFTYFGTLLAKGQHAAAPVGPELKEMRGRRLAMIERIARPYTEGMDPELARGICAVVAGLARVQFMQAMHEHWALDGAQCGRAVAWALDTLIDALRRQKRKRDTPRSKTSRTRSKK